MQMKKTALCLMILLGIGYLTSCTPPGHYSDAFYNFYFNDNEYTGYRLPLLEPYSAKRDSSSSRWSVNLMPHGPWVHIPNSQEEYCYCQIEELGKFAVKNGVIIAYSSYVDGQAGAYIQNGYYHWFVIVPDKTITLGFQTEDEFNQYIQTLGIQNPEWQTPDAAFDKFERTGCLDWIPDCK
jgi:hypothetical protein